jgi:hypothetical protein
MMRRELDAVGARMSRYGSNRLRHVRVPDFDCAVPRTRQKSIFAN